MTCVIFPKTAGVRGFLAEGKKATHNKAMPPYSLAMRSKFCKKFAKKFAAELPKFAKNLQKNCQLRCKFF